MLFGLFILSTAQAGPLLVAEYVPPGLSEMAWVADGQLSGTQVAEHDGLLVPPLRAQGGWVFGRTGLLAPRWAWDGLVQDEALGSTS